MFKCVSNQYDSRSFLLISPVHFADCLPTKLFTFMNAVACFARYTSNPSQPRLFYCFGRHVNLTQFLVTTRNIQCQCAIFLSLTTGKYLAEYSLNVTACFGNLCRHHLLSLYTKIKVQRTSVFYMMTAFN